MDVKQYELLKPIFGANAGQTFYQESDGTYSSADKSVRLAANLVETNTEYFKPLPILSVWKPNQGQMFYVVDLAGAVGEIPWDETKTISLWRAGNCFQTREQAAEAARDFQALMKSYQKKFTMQKK